MKIKALSLTQPWAQLIVEGRKTIETRRWKTDYRGLLAICATRGPKPDCRRCSASWQASLTDVCWDKAGTICQAPYSCAVAIVGLVDCRPMTAGDEPAAQCELYDGAWAWVLSDVRVIPPVCRQYVRGMHRLFDIEIDEKLLRDLGVLCG